MLTARSALLLSLSVAGLSVLGACSSDDKAAAPGGASSSSSSSSGAPGEDGGTTDETKSDAAPASTSPLITARPYATTVPKSYDAKVATPLVLLLHGYSGTAKIQDDYFKVSALAEKKKFLVALPDGKKDSLGNQFWNATDACCDGNQSGVDDAAYLTAVIADMKARFNVDPKRVYVVGHSNGGFMAHRLACDLSTEIAGIVSLAGATFADPAKCKGTQPVAVLQVHGDADGTVAYEGGSLIAGAPAFPSAKATVATWANKNGCGAELTDAAQKLDLDTGLAGDDTKVERHACTSGAAELWTIASGAHVPSFQATWADLFYGFLESHPKP